jgi:hypothetical protein
MLSVGEDVEADALSKRGWTVSAIARHLGRDRKTVRSYLSGQRAPGVRRPARPDALADYRSYVVARFADVPRGRFAGVPLPLTRPTVARATPQRPLLGNRVATGTVKAVVARSSGRCSGARSGGH